LSQPDIITRFAPSPTGYLHRGHAFSALTAHDAARAAGGRFLLRIEDIDSQRCRPQFEAAIYEDLSWLGLAWEQPVRRQSEHLDLYRQALARLIERGVMYRCFKTRAEILDEIARAPHEPTPPYFGQALPAAEEARLMSDGRSFAWRLSISRALDLVGDAARLTFVDQAAGVVAARPETAGDVVLARKDLGVAYHLAVVVDDAAQGVTDVIRGADLFEATHIQRLLQALLDLPPPRYRHHPLLLRPDGKRFAKRDQAETLRDIRVRGVAPEALRAELAAAAAVSERG
jgi:glutamyl-Q tRNA(Asp) synthetase